MSPYTHEPGRRAPGSTTSKLRDSCHACALAKVKCHKEKPTCSRCARRGTACEYFATKRPGRKRDSSQLTSSASSSSEINRGGAISTVGPAFPGGPADPWSRPTNSTSGVLFAGSSSYLTPQAFSPNPSSANGSVSGSTADSSSNSDLFPGFLMPLETSLSSTLAGINNDFEDIFNNSPIDFLELGTPEPNNLTHAQQNDVSNLLIPDDVNIDPVLATLPAVHRSSASRPSSPSPGSQSPPKRDRSVSTPRDPCHSCLVQTLDLMKKLWRAESAPCTMANSPAAAVSMAPATTRNPEPTAQTVVTENNQAIEAVSSMLQCTCAEDGYLLTMLSMIVLKMLARYAAVARRHHLRQIASGLGGNRHSSGGASKKDSIRAVNSYSADDECPGRMTVQLILSELHRVQRLVNQLSPMLKARVSGDDSGVFISRKRSRSGYGVQTGSLDDEFMTAAFSVNTLTLLEKDLRSSLAALSSEIIDMLRTI